MGTTQPGPAEVSDRSRRFGKCLLWVAFMTVGHKTTVNPQAGPFSVEKVDIRPRKASFAHPRNFAVLPLAGFAATRFRAVILQQQQMLMT